MANEKKGLTIDEQIIYLKENKNIVFENEKEEKEAKEYLLKYSYTDVINPLKVLFCSSYDKCHQYEYKTNWSDIQKLHQRIKEVEGLVLNKLLLLELQLKSSFCEWLSNEIKLKTYKDFEDFMYKIELYDEKNDKTYRYDNKRIRNHYTNIYEKNYNEQGYKGEYKEYWWLLIMAFSFGDLQKLLDARFIDNKEISVLKSVIEKSTIRKINRILEGGKNLRTYVVLRNALSHQTNLLIYLDQQIRLNNKSRFIERIKVLKEFYNFSEKNISIIDNYFNIRNNNNEKFKRKSAEDFKKYEI